MACICGIITTCVCCVLWDVRLGGSELGCECAGFVVCPGPSQDTQFTQIVKQLGNYQNDLPNVNHEHI